MRPGSIRLVAALAILVAVLSCSSADGIPGPRATGRKSNSMLLAGLRASGPVDNSLIASERNAGDASAAVSAQVSYVSLLPGTFSDGTTATVSNLRTAESLTVAMVDGGFDPRPISASLGDTLEVRVSLTGGKPDVVAYIAVARPAPRIVRTRPPRGQTDVPLNMVITIVFTEPLDPASVNAGSITLSAGATPVSGEVRVLPTTGYAVEFTPSALLAPTTTYTLTVSSTVTNLAGTSFGSASGVTFTTAQASGSGGIAFVTISPDSAATNVGAELQLTPLLTDSDGQTTIAPYQSVRWSSSAPDIAYVNPASGLLVGVGAGTAVISARRSAYDERPATARITVNPATTREGAIVTALCNDEGQCGLYAVNPDGSNGRFLTSHDGYVDPIDMDPVWSPDGTSIAFRSQRDCDHATTRICHNDLYVMRADGSGIRGDGSGLRSLTTGSGLDVGGMSWSPDGNRIVFAGAVFPTDLYPREALYVVNADGSGLRLLVASPPGGSVSWPDWSPDGSKIAYTVVVRDTSAIDIVDADGSNDVRISMPSASNGDLRPHWSPDGKRIAFTRSWSSVDYGESQAFVMDADGSNVAQITHDLWSRYPVWSPDGTQLAVIGNGSAANMGLSGWAVVNADGSAGRSLPLSLIPTGMIRSAHSWRRAAAAASSVTARAKARP